MFNLCVCPQLFGEEMQVQLYAPPYSKLDPSIAVMLLISIVTVALGGFWSGACERCDIADGHKELNLYILIQSN